MSAGIEKLQNLLTKTLSEFKTDMNKTSELNKLEIMALINEILTRLEVMEKLLEGKKKTVQKEKKPETEAKAAKDGVAEAKPAAKFPINTMTWYREQYKQNQELITGYFNLAKEKYNIDMLDLLDKDETIKKKKGDQQVNARMTTSWTYFKKNCPDVITAVGRDYEQAKSKFKEDNTPKQEVGEVHSDAE